MKIVLPWTKFVTRRTVHAFFFIHGDNKMPFEAVLKIYSCLLICNR